MFLWALGPLSHGPEAATGLDARAPAKAAGDSNARALHWRHTLPYPGKGGSSFWDNSDTPVDDIHPACPSITYVSMLS